MSGATNANGPTVLVAGYYGFGNTGDEAILTSLLAGLRSRNPDARFSVVSGDPAETGRRYGVAGIAWKDTVALADAVRRTDLVVVGGGGLFQDYWGFDPRALLTPAHGGVSFYTGPALLAAVSRKPLALFGLGFGPLESADARRFTRAVAEAAASISVRDPDSKALLGALGVDPARVRVTADAAFTLGFDKIYPEDVLAGAGVEPRAPIVGVALRNWSVGVDPAFWEREVSSALDRFIERTNGTLLFVPFERSPWASADDFDLAPRIRKSLRHAERAATLTDLRPPAEIAGLLAGCDLVLGMRLHSLVFAAAAGVSSVGLIYDPKVRSLLAKIGPDLGLELVDIRSADLLGRMLAALENRDERRLRLLGVAAELRADSEADLDRLAALLTAPPAAPELTDDLATLFEDALSGNMRQRDDLASQLDALRTEHSALTERSVDLGRALAGADKRAAEAERRLQEAEKRLEFDRDAHQRDTARIQLAHLHERTLLERQIGETRDELGRIQTSRLWRTANLYWTLRRRARRAAEPLKKAARRVLGRPPADWAGPDTARAALQAAPAEITVENRHDVVCFPIIDWDFRFQRPQQLMKRYARAGHRVFYIAQLFRASGPPYEITEKAENIFEVSLLGVDRNVYKDRLDEEDVATLFRGMDALRRDRSLGATASIVQLPFWAPVAARLREERAWPIVYDLMDHHAGFSSNTAAMVQEERALLESADLVLASSAFLEDAARQRTTRVLRLPNACDYDHFAGAAGAPKNARPVIGYYGAISDWFDVALVKELAQKRPDWDFLLVGSTWGADLGDLPKMPNVELPGEKAYGEIPRWLERFDVAIIPFKRTPLTEATNPVKAYEIFAAGKPLVSVPLPELSAMAPLVRTASTAADFEREIEAALAERGPEAAAARRAFAAKNRWEDRFESMSAAVAAAFPPLSVVVVTFNNRDLNRLCLESIAARTEWPNYEVIVVDNASSDDTQELLAEIAAGDPRVRVIANDENRGFAAANNEGLAAASGDYLVMLNNDTVVPRGWASGLIRHLKANPKLGLVGPVTNAIANAAKIEVGYTEISDMPAWAAEWVREHDGDTFPIPMLAFFCAALPRQVWETVGPLDERFGIGMFEDNDYNRRVREKGWDIRCARDVFVHHWQKASFRLLGKEAYLALFDENRKKFEEKWGERWKAEGIDLWQRADLGFYRDQLEAIRRRIAGAPGAVIFLPSVGWGIHLFQRPHHLARTFARAGWVAVFDCSNAHDDVNGFKEIEPNLYLFRGPVGVLQEIEAPILWAFPYNFAQKDGYARDARVVYDWIDDLSVFPYDPDMLRANHERALSEATVVASVARKLHEEAIAHRPDAIYLPNGVEYERFATPAPLPLGDRDLDAFRSAGRPIAGYYGALAEWFDYDLLDEVARLKPDWSFLLIGPMYDQSLQGRPMLSRPNVCWIGPRDYHSLPGYLRLFDVATIPFQINDITTATSPLKLFEYFAGGKPVVTTPMPECMAHPEVAIARDAREFAQALEAEHARAKDPEFRDRLRAIGRENSWDARVRTVLARLERSSAAAAPAGEEVRTT